MKIYTVMLSVCLSMFQFSAYANEESSDSTLKEYAYSSIQWAVIKSVNDNKYSKNNVRTIDPGALILSLGYTDQTEARDALVGLVEIYLGSAATEALTSALTRQGKAIKGLLVKLKTQPVSCSGLNENDQAIFKQGWPRCRTQISRDKYLDRIIQLIEKNVVVEYEL